MEEIFVTKLRINKVRHLENLEIPLSDTERKHLILTGKNGSGKTSVLERINAFLEGILKNNIDLKKIEADIVHLEKLNKWNEQTNKNETERLDDKADVIKSAIEELSKESPVFLFFQNPISSQDLLIELHREKFAIKFFKAKRNFLIKQSNGPHKIERSQPIDATQYLNQNFMQFMINMRYELLEAKNSNENTKALEIETWFSTFEQTLREILENYNLDLVFDKNYWYYYLLDRTNNNYTNLSFLSDGYASFLSIVTELMMRMERKKKNNFYDLQGLVLIDEIETHLHIDLQKKILPFLTSFFPKIQFIVTTHSPFVLSSIDNAVIYDLEKQQRIEDLSDYSYQELVETYFGTDQYSDYVKQKLNEYEVLIQKENHTDSEEDKLYEIRKYFRKLPFFLSPELQLKIQSLELYSQNSQV